MDQAVDVYLPTCRQAYIKRTLQSFRAKAVGNVRSINIVDDSGDPVFGQWLETEFPDCNVIHHERNLGYREMMRRSWSTIAKSDGAPYVMWLEDDFVFDRDIPLGKMADILDGDHKLAQCQLLRNPCYGPEIRAGGVPHQDWNAYTRLGDRVEHRKWYTCNPSMMRRELFRTFDWPSTGEGADSEAIMGRRLVRQGYRFTFLGNGEPWITHIGTTRAVKTVKTPEERLSILVPYRHVSDYQDRVWSWVRGYLEHALPEAQIVVGQNDDIPFSRSAALNDAAEMSTGRYLLTLDSDAWLDAGVVRQCVDTIAGSPRPLWYVPWKQRRNLMEAETRALLEQPPTASPMLLDCESTYEARCGIAVILSRIAYNRVGGFDPRFKGWGAEDMAFFRALDSLYGTGHRTTNKVWHLWHPRNGRRHTDIAWEGQTERNDGLYQRYREASRASAAMQLLVDEHRGPKF